MKFIEGGRWFEISIDGVPRSHCAGCVLAPCSPDGQTEINHRDNWPMDGIKGICQASNDGLTGLKRWRTEQGSNGRD